MQNALHQRAEIEARVQRVVDRYISERTERGTGPSLNTLRDASVDHLRSDAEVREVIRRVGELAPPSPIQELEKDLQDADLVRLFPDAVTPEGRISMTTESVRKLAARQRESR